MNRQLIGYFHYYSASSILPCSDESWCLSTEEEEDEKEAWHLHGEQESEGLVRGRANLNWKIITNAD